MEKTTKKKRITKFVLLSLSGFFVVTQAIAQVRQIASISSVNEETRVASPVIKPLKIGDPVPNIEFSNLFNYPEKIAHYNDFKGKLVIIDFWETFCTNCMKALPKIEKLKETFGEKLQIITVTKYNTKEEIINTLQRFKVLKDFRLPTIVHDDKLFRYFPFELISHVVWIGPDGIVKAITGTEHINEANIRTILDGKQVDDWPVKQDIPDFDYKKPLLALSNNNVSNPDFFYFSALTGRLDGVDATTGIGVDSIKKTVTINHFNTPLLDLCKGVIKGELTGDFDLKEVILQVNNPDRYNPASNRKGYYWTANGTSENTFCYSITLPLGIANNEMKRIIREDLKRWLDIALGINVIKEKRMMKCLVLVKTSNTEKLIKSKGGVQSITIDDKKARFNNLPLIHLVWHLNNNVESAPWVIDETGISRETKVDLNLQIESFEDIPALRKALQPYCLDLIEAEREREMYVITERALKEK